MRKFPVKESVQLLILFLGLVLIHWAFLEQLDALAFDLTLRIRGPEAPDERIVIVAIDDGSLSSVGPWPWPPEKQDLLFSRILEQDPLALGIDLVIDRPLTAYPSLLNEERVVLATSLGVSLDSSSRNLYWQEPPGINSEFPKLGHIHADKDSDGVCRSLPLFVNWKGIQRWAFSVELSGLATGASPEDVYLDRNGLIIGEITVPRLASSIDSSGDSAGVLTSSVGDHLLLNYRGASGTFPSIPAARFFDQNEADGSLLKGKIVLLGAISYSLGDHLSTAFSGPNEMPGVEIHANALDTIINQRFIQAMIEPGITILLLGVLVGTWVVFWFWSRGRSPLTFIIILIASLAIPVGVLLTNSYWLPMATIFTTVFLSGVSAQFMHYSRLNQQLNGRFIDLAKLTREQHSIEETLPNSNRNFGKRTIEWKLTVLGDVTEAALRSNREREEMMSFVSHELKTPLTSIQGFSDLLLRSDSVSEEQQKEALGLIRSESKRISKMVNDYLNLSRLEHRTLKPHLQLCDIKDVVRDASRLTQSQLKEKSILLKGIETIPSAAINGDPDLLTQVFLNLLGNAVKFSPDHSEISVTATVNDGFIQISVLDQGMGISADDLPKVFKKFYRGHQSSADVVPGSGLGLAFVKEVIEKHNGEILVESEPNKGTEVSVRIPLEKAG